MKRRASHPGSHSVPDRLLEGDSVVAELLRMEAERPAPSGAPFAVLSARRKRRQFRQMALWATAFALPLGLLTFAAHRDGFSISAEHPIHAAAEGADPVSSKHMASGPVVQKGETKAESTTPPSAVETVAQPAPVGPGTDAARRADTGAPARETAILPRGSLDVSTRQRALADCASTSRGGDYELAMVCYDQRAQGEGTSAELGLLESARIAWRALRSTDRALSRLDEYERRFQLGALRREAALLRVEVLYSTGDVHRQRAAVEQALILVPERSAELRKQALDMAVRTGDCAAAREHLKSLIEAGEEPAAFNRTMESCGPAASSPTR